MQIKGKTAGKLEETRPDGLHIAVVDDSAAIRDQVVASLEPLNGVTAIWLAHDVPSGLSLLDSQPFDLLILDIELPGQSGLDLLKIARARKMAGVIIMFSIHDHPSLRQKCAEQGADYFFHKLSEFDRLADVCRELVERRKGQTGPRTGSETR